MVQVHGNGTGKKENRQNMLIACLFGIVSSVILSICTISSLESEDRISVKRGFCLFSLGLIFFTSLFNIINLLALKTMWGLKFRKKFQMSVTDVLDISNKVVSSVQAVLSCAAGYVVCTYSCARSFLRTSHYASEAYAWFGTAYFLYDIWSMYCVHDSKTAGRPQPRQQALQQRQPQQQPQPQQCDEDAEQKSKPGIQRFGSYVVSQPIIIMHHLFIGSFGFLVIVYLRGGLGDCVYGYVYLMELSTPFVSMRGVLSLMGMKSSRLYLFNGLFMLFTFFVCRVVMFPYVIYLYSQVIDKNYFDAIMTLPRGCKVGISILMLPQFYWFWLMLKGAGKVFCEPKTSAAPPPRKHRSANIKLTSAQPIKNQS